MNKLKQKAKSIYLVIRKINKLFIIFLIFLIPFLISLGNIHYEFIETKYIHNDIINEILNKDKNFFEKFTTKSLLNYRFKRPSGKPLQDNDAKWHCYVNFYPLNDKKLTEFNDKNLLEITDKDPYIKYGKCLSWFMSNQADPKNKKRFLPTSYQYIGKDEKYGRHWDLLAKGDINNIHLAQPKPYEVEKQNYYYEYDNPQAKKSKYRNFIVVSYKKNTIKVISVYAKCSFLEEKLWGCDKKNIW